MYYLKTKTYFAADNSEEAINDEIVSDIGKHAFCTRNTIPWHAVTLTTGCSLQHHSCSNVISFIYKKKIKEFRQT